MNGLCHTLDICLYVIWLDIVLKLELDRQRSYLDSEEVSYIKIPTVPLSETTCLDKGHSTLDLIIRLFEDHFLI